MKITDLKTCPFCGGKARVFRNWYLSNKEKWQVICKECRIETPFYVLKLHAIFHWNKRQTEKENLPDLSCTED